ncbi:NirD/YgiW/YdeI family stress tolerance protein [Acinetobacter bouvetii]|uniref:NirD/YgiW/YdeI family stress tolerance protein n=1 Tax=Acinetobacter bouvetii TaxID=202951 RepID=A0A811GCC1_9GAMM|nr:NirD/YgiW/YdeI family stress tolerance protein [Acinetobacter bouvetii]CAB1220164.1 hypothetical protein SFB21_2540 [Acinetobacter bouvetii]
MKKMLWVVFTSVSMLCTISSYAGESNHMMMGCDQQMRNGNGHMMKGCDHWMMNENGHRMMAVAEVKKLADQTMVMLSGTIVKHLRGDHFELKDGTGSIDIDVDEDLWRPLALKVGDQVNVMGEVDAHANKASSIDVMKIEKMTSSKDKWMWYNQH